MSRHFNQAGMIFKSATCPLRNRAIRFIEASSLRPDSPRMSPQNETVKLSRRQMIVARYAIEVAVRNIMPDMMKPFMTQSTLFCIHSSAHSSGV